MAVRDLRPSRDLPLRDREGSAIYASVNGNSLWAGDNLGARATPVGTAFLTGCWPETPAQSRPLLCLLPALWGVPCSGIQLPSLLADLWLP